MGSTWSAIQRIKDVGSIPATSRGKKDVENITILFWTLCVSLWPVYYLCFSANAKGSR